MNAECAGIKLRDPLKTHMPYLSALEVWSRQGAIQIYVYLYLTWNIRENLLIYAKNGAAWSHLSLRYNHDLMIYYWMRCSCVFIAKATDGLHTVNCSAYYSRYRYNEDRLTQWRWWVQKIAAHRQTHCTKSVDLVRRSAMYIYQMKRVRSWRPCCFSELIIIIIIIIIILYYVQLVALHKIRANTQLHKKLNIHENTNYTEQ